MDPPDERVKSKASPKPKEEVKGEDEGKEKVKEKSEVEQMDEGKDKTSKKKKKKKKNKGKSQTANLPIPPASAPPAVVAPTSPQFKFPKPPGSAKPTRPLTHPSSTSEPPQRPGTSSEQPAPSRPAITPQEITKVLNRVEEWNRSAKNSRRTVIVELHANTSDDWDDLGELFKKKYRNVSRKNILETMSLALATLRKTRFLGKVKAGAPKDESSHLNVCVAALGALKELVTAANSQLESGNPDETFYTRLIAAYLSILNEVMKYILDFEGPVKCALFDLIGATGYKVWCLINENDQRKLIVFLIGCAQDDDENYSITAKSKVGRCLGKLVEFPSLQQDVVFLNDVFELCCRHIYYGENIVKVSYCWTFANLTDAVVATNHGGNEALMCREFPTLLVKAGLRSLEVPPKGRYSACRACGNILFWIKSYMLRDPVNGPIVVKIVESLLAMIGSGLDYKLRWNAAHALGLIIANDSFFHAMKAEVLHPVIKALAKWAATSQNYKERTQCIQSLGKGDVRYTYGNLTPLIWEKACLAVARLPVEETDCIDKLRVEAVLLLCHIMRQMEFPDFEILNDVILANEELLYATVRDCKHALPLTRLDEAQIAFEHMESFYTMRAAPPYHPAIKAMSRVLELVLKEDDCETTDSEVGTVSSI